MSESLAAQLSELGLTRNEALAYLCLLEADAEGLTGYEVAARASIPRSAVYGVLRKLEDRGAAFSSGNKPARYVPVEPQRMLEDVRRQTEVRIEQLSRELQELPARPRPEPVWIVSRYEVILDRVREMIRHARHSVYLSVWRRELDELADALFDAAPRLQHIVVYCLDEAGPLPVGTFLWRDEQPDHLKTGWSHKVLAVSDNDEALVGGAEPRADNQAVWTRNRSLVDVATNHIILDITLLSRQSGRDCTATVAPMMRPHIPDSP